jgi:hypothetical protein
MMIINRRRQELAGDCDLVAKMVAVSDGIGREIGDLRKHRVDRDAVAELERDRVARHITGGYSKRRAITAGRWARRLEQAA